MLDHACSLTDMLLAYILNFSERLRELTDGLLKPTGIYQEQEISAKTGSCFRLSYPYAGND